MNTQREFHKRLGENTVFMPENQTLVHSRAERALELTALLWEVKRG